MMKTDPYLTEDGLKAVRKTGWPEWEEDGYRVSIRHSGGDGFYKACWSEEEKEWFFVGYTGTHEAHVLLRDWFRVWLEKHDIMVSCAHTKLVKYAGWRWEGNDYFKDPVWIRAVKADTYDAALIAAVLAAEEKK
uniref:Phage ABA sandwich domain-containing protein n=1 Tax=viral metagenome TaxID=1070528 RepID=A0A6M3LK56_9ZZZZ